MGSCPKMFVVKKSKPAGSPTKDQRSRITQDDPEKDRGHRSSKTTLKERTKREKKERERERARSPYHRIALCKPMCVLVSLCTQGM